MFVFTLNVFLSHKKFTQTAYRSCEAPTCHQFRLRWRIAARRHDVFMSTVSSDSATEAACFVDKWRGNCVSVTLYIDSNETKNKNDSVWGRFTSCQMYLAEGPPTSREDTPTCREGACHAVKCACHAAERHPLSCSLYIIFSLMSLFPPRTPPNVCHHIIYEHDLAKKTPPPQTYVLYIFSATFSRFIIIIIVQIYHSDTLLFLMSLLF